MEKWKEHIIEGNQRYKNKEFDQAISAYERSKERVKKLFDEWMNPEEVIAALLASYHNIAELHLQNDRKYLSFLELQQARTFLNQRASKLSQNNSRRLALQKGIDKNEVEILSFMKNHQLNPTKTNTTLLLQSKSPTPSMTIYRGK